MNPPSRHIPILNHTHDEGNLLDAAKKSHPTAWPSAWPDRRAIFSDKEVASTNLKSVDGVEATLENSRSKLLYQVSSTTT